VQEKIRELLKKYTKDGAVPDASESLFDGGYLDSFSLADFVGELESEFHIKIPDSDLNPRKFETIERIEEYVAARS
jgi:acyl carrier protein